MKLFSNAFYLINQRFVVIIIALFFATILFNTTYLGLGTNVPIIIISVGLFSFLTKKKIKTNSKNALFIWFAVLILLSTMLSGGVHMRECFKIFITVCFVYLSTSIEISDSEVKYFSLFICLSYLVYAILVTMAIGQDTQFYGRAQIRILNSETPLDPNVTAAVFVLPLILSLYNLLYGKYKILAGILLILFAISIIVLGSRGATVSCIIPCCLLLLRYFTSRSTKLVVKLFSIVSILFAAYFVYNFVTEQSAIFGFDRVLDFSGDDASNGRTEVWIERLDLWQGSPLWGYGVNYEIGGEHRGMACHNTFIQCLHYGGIIGICLFLIPIVFLFKRKTISKVTKYSLFISVFMPIFFIDTLQERTLWNFIMFYSMLSMRPNAEECLLWDINGKNR